MLSEPSQARAVVAGTFDPGREPYKGTSPKAGPSGASSARAIFARADFRAYRAAPPGPHATTSPWKDMSGRWWHGR
jgi:hypothetical protein